MRLYELIKEVAETSLLDMEITGLTSDTRAEVTEGSIFVCIKGKTFDGHDAAKQMLEKGFDEVVIFFHKCDLFFDCPVIQSKPSKSIFDFL